jgi:hypothetical protein
MNDTGYDMYQRKLREIATVYRTQGYAVPIEPGPEELPAFLAGLHPDLSAQGPHDSVGVEVKVGTTRAASERFRDLAEMIRQQPGWRFSLVVIDPRSDEVAPQGGNKRSMPSSLSRISTRIVLLVLAGPWGQVERQKAASRLHRSVLRPLGKVPGNVEVATHQAPLIFNSRAI